MAVHANKIPGPAVFENLDNLSFKILDHTGTTFQELSTQTPTTSTFKSHEEIV